MPNIPGFHGQVYSTPNDLHEYAFISSRNTLYISTRTLHNIPGIL